MRKPVNNFFPKKRDQPHRMMPEGRQVRLETQLGGILALSVSVEMGFSRPLKEFLSLWKRKRYFLTKIPTKS